MYMPSVVYSFTHLYTYCDILVLRCCGIKCGGTLCSLGASSGIGCGGTLCTPGAKFRIEPVEWVPRRGKACPPACSGKKCTYNWTSPRLQKVFVHNSQLEPDCIAPGLHDRVDDLRIPRLDPVPLAGGDAALRRHPRYDMCVRIVPAASLANSGSEHGRPNALLRCPGC